MALTTFEAERRCRPEPGHQLQWCDHPAPNAQNAEPSPHQRQRRSGGPGWLLWAVRGAVDPGDLVWEGVGVPLCLDVYSWSAERNRATIDAFLAEYVDLAASTESFGGQLTALPVGFDGHKARVLVPKCPTCRHAVQITGAKITCLSSATPTSTNASPTSSKPPSAGSPQCRDVSRVGGWETCGSVAR